MKFRHSYCIPAVDEYDLQKVSGYCSLPSPRHSFIAGLKPSFSANPSHRSLLLLLHD